LNESLSLIFGLYNQLEP